MKARLTAVFCLIMVLVMSLLGGIQSTASQPPAAPPPGELTSGGEVPVTIIPSSLLGSESLQEDKVVSIVTEELGLSSAATPYLKAKVRVLYSEAGEADSLIVYLPHKDTYLFETAKIELGENYSVVSVEKDYVEQEGDFSQEGATYATCPDDTVQIVVSSCCTEFPSSVAAVNNSYNAAVAAGYETVKLLGSQENTTAIKNWLSCPNLIYWGRVGHGNSSGILLDDASLTTSNYWNGMAGELPGKILYFNSCQVFNNPLKTSIFNTGVAKFIGGICSLWVGTSEPVWQCWNEHDFVQDPPPGGEEDEMCYWSQQCESDMNYPDPGCHGCGGPGPHVFPTPGPPQPTPTPGPTSTPTNTPTPEPVEPILLVDDDDGSSYEGYYTAALDALGEGYNTWNVRSQGSPSASELQKHDIVIWFTGDDYTTTLTSTDQSNLATYLNSGGNLFITGQDIGYDIRSASFYGNYLHASYIRDDTNTYGLTGYDILSGVSVTISGSGGANNQGYPSEIGLGSGAVGLFDYAGSYTWGGLRWEGAYRLVYLSFGYEAINTSAGRNSVMDALLGWLEGGAPPPTPTPTPTGEPTTPPTPTPTPTSSGGW